LGVRIPPGLPLAPLITWGTKKMNNILTFFSEVKAELKKVTWPSRDELIGSVIIVCILVAVFSVILAGMDSLFGMIIRYLIR
jgi:preprotein translocase subunit SecE